VDVAGRKEVGERTTSLGWHEGTSGVKASSPKWGEEVIAEYISAL